MHPAYTQSAAAAQEGGTSKSNGRDPNRKAFALARKAFLDQTKRHPDFAVAYEIAQGFNYDTFVGTGWLVSWYSLRTIADALGISKDAVQRRIDRLETAGLLAVDPGHQRVPTRYYALTYVSPLDRDITAESKSAPVEPTYVSVSESYVSVSETYVSDSPGVPRQTLLDSCKDSESKQGRKIPATALSDEEPAGDHPPQPEHDGVVHRLVAKSIAAGKPEIERPLAHSPDTGNVVSIKPKRDFDRFWEIFPRDNNNDVKRAAINFHKACKLPGVNAGIIIAGAQRYAAECAANPQKWKKLAPNWLFDECWNNVPEPGRSNSHRSSSVVDDFGGLKGWVCAALDMEEPK